MLPLLRLKIKQLRNNAAAFAGCAVLTTGMLCSAGRTAKAQTSFPRIMSTFPAGVQRGKTTDVTVWGLPRDV